MKFYTKLLNILLIQKYFNSFINSPEKMLKCLQLKAQYCKVLWFAIKLGQNDWDKNRTVWSSIFSQ